MVSHQSRKRNCALWKSSLSYKYKVLEIWEQDFKELLNTYKIVLKPLVKTPIQLSSISIEETVIKIWCRPIWK